MSNLDQELDKILDEYAGRILTYDEIARRQRHDPQRLQADKDHAKRVATQAIQALITTQKQELLSEIEKELPPDAAITKEDLGVDLARKSAANAVLGQVKSIITTKRGEV